MYQRNDLNNFKVTNKNFIKTSNENYEIVKENNLFNLEVNKLEKKESFKLNFTGKMKLFKFTNDYLDRIITVTSKCGNYL